MRFSSASASRGGTGAGCARSDGRAAEGASQQDVWSAESELRHHVPQKVQSGGLPLREAGGQRESEEDRHGIVQPGLQLQGGTDPLAEHQPAAAQHREHRRRIRRRDHRTDEEGHRPGEAEEPSTHGDEGRGAGHADRRQGQGRREPAAEGGEGGVEPAVEEDEDQRHRAEAEGEAVVLEADAPDPLLAGQDHKARVTATGSS